LHELARAGIEVERQPRPVTVHRFDVSPIPGDPMRWRAVVECSSGTYVRTLAADLGAALGGGAHLTDLRRTAVGPFGEDETLPLDAVTPEGLLSPAEALRWLPAVVVDEATALDVTHGRVLPREQLERLASPTPAGGDPPEGPWRVLDAAGQLLAVYEDHGEGRVKPSVVLVAAS
jgi:tRNA pseudouridine55 synthase